MQNSDFKRPVDMIQSFIESAGKHTSDSKRFTEALVQTNIAGVGSIGRVVSMIQTVSH